MFGKKEVVKTDYVLIGAGIMTATLAALLNELNPSKNIIILERMAEVASESSSDWNNAGTGHAALCELNYTPTNEDGTVDLKKAIQINSQFEESKQFWTFMLNSGYFSKKSGFLNPIPHMSFVYGADDVAFLRKRYTAMQAHPFFSEMAFSENSDQIKEWVPLFMENRKSKEPVAATRVEKGTDVNFGVLTNVMIDYLKGRENIILKLGVEVKDVERKVKGEGPWVLDVKSLITKKKAKVHADFVFIGAGGGTLKLLEKSNIEEAEGYGGFPVGGQWLVCKNNDVIKKHFAKVYGKAKVGAPPMSVPHLDTRRIKGKRSLFFGPFAGFSTKFLKNGSYMDLIKTIEHDNVLPMLAAGWQNRKLTKYLIDQVRMSFEDRMDALREYFPEAKNEDWELKKAGQRVQVIKKDNEQVGILGFGTEVVSHKDGSIAALLGASPGASTATSIMLEILEKCFPEYHSEEWQKKIKEMVPYRSKELIANPEKITEARKVSNELYDIDILKTFTIFHS